MESGATPASSAAVESGAAVESADNIWYVQHYGNQSPSTTTQPARKKVAYQLELMAPCGVTDMGVATAIRSTMNMGRHVAIRAGGNTVAASLEVVGLRRIGS